jgi:hypothetical protein
VAFEWVKCSERNELPLTEIAATNENLNNKQLSVTQESNGEHNTFQPNTKTTTVEGSEQSKDIPCEISNMLLHEERKRSLCNQLRIIHHALRFRTRQPVVSYTCTRTNYYHYQCIPSRPAYRSRKRDREIHYVVKSQDIYKSIFLGSSMNSLILTKNVTASRPSSSLWSYVRARYIIWHIN